MIEDKKRAVILGANSLVSPYLVRRLAALGYQGELLGRHRPLAASGGGDVGFSWTRFDIEKPEAWRAPTGALVFSLAPLWLIPQLIPTVSEAGHLVALSSTSTLAYAKSADPREFGLSSRLLKAEEQVLAAAHNAGLRCTILRPTMIYGQAQDLNITNIITFVDRWGFFPLAAPGKGLRQPVHADDVAAAAIAATQSSATPGRIYEIGGAETLTFRDMVISALRQAGRPTRILALPAGLLRMGVKIVGRILPHVNAAGMIARMNQDQAFSIEAARQAFGYAPRAFQLDPDDVPRRL